MRLVWSQPIYGVVRKSDHRVMPNGSLSLAEYPTDMVRLKCSKCGRTGQYRKATLIGKYGADIPLPELLRRIAVDCPKVDALGNDPCGAHYPDLA